MLRDELYTPKERGAIITREVCCFKKRGTDVDGILLWKLSVDTVVYQKKIW
jgi:hypothetical protein